MSAVLDLPPFPPQQFVPNGWKREYKVFCEHCGTVGHFDIVSDQPRNDTWCEQAIRQNLRQSYWQPGDHADYCPVCKWDTVMGGLK